MRASPERHQHLLRKALDQLQAEPLEVVLLDELVQVDRQQLKGDAQVVAEHEVLLDVDDMVHVLRIVVAQVLQHLELNLGLQAAQKVCRRLHGVSYCAKGGEHSIVCN